MNAMLKQLGQKRENSTIAVLVYSPGHGRTGKVTSITFCNTSSASARAYLFIDNDGEVYDESTALFWNIRVDGNSTVQFTNQKGFILNGSNASLAYKTSIANAITITVDGEEIR